MGQQAEWFLRHGNWAPLKQTLLHQEQRGTSIRQKPFTRLSIAQNIPRQQKSNLQWSICLESLSQVKHDVPEGHLGLLRTTAVQRYIYVSWVSFALHYLVVVGKGDEMRDPCFGFSLYLALGGPGIGLREVRLPRVIQCCLYMFGIEVCHAWEAHHEPPASVALAESRPKPGFSF